MPRLGRRRTLSGKSIEALFRRHSVRRSAPERAAGLSALLSTALGVKRDRPRLGPYELSDKLGEGGMGVVYEADDPRLERKVAIKLLRDDLGREDRDAIVAEARSLAELAHPNVVQVFATGVDGNRAWVAMELVDGGTLSDWARSHPPGSARRTTAALSLLAGIGNALATAHAAGFVHRDVKPTNVLVGTDQRARLVDFGLARKHSDSPVTHEPWLGTAGSGSSPPTAPESVAFAGTPRYMAPEQFDGVGASPLTDQYAFCLMAWELLYGDNPFEAPTIVAQVTAKAHARPTPPHDSTVRRAVGRALAQGLDPDPARRFPDMLTLLGALQPTTAKNRGAIAVALGTASAVGLMLLHSPEDRPECDRAWASEPIAALWKGAQRDSVAHALESATVSYASNAFATVDAAIAEFSDAWVKQRVAACEATWHDRTANVEALDAAVACLDGQRQVVEAFIGQLAQSEGSVEHAATGAAKLPDPSECAATEGTDGPPAIESEAAAQRLAQARAASMVGDERRAESLAMEVVDDARHEQWPTALGDALEVAARARTKRGFDAVSPELLAEAHAVAIAADDPTRAFRRAIFATRVAGLDHKPDEAQRWFRHAQTAAAQLSPSPMQRAHLRRAACTVAYSRSDLAAAETACREALSIIDEVEASGSPEPIERDALEDQLARMLSKGGRPDEAEAIQLQILQRRTERLGADHPHVAAIHYALANNALMTRRTSVAVQRWQRAFEIYEASHGPDARWTISSLSGIGAALKFSGDLEGAEQKLSEAWKRALRNPNPGAPKIGTNLASVYEKQGRMEEALRLLRKVQALEETILPPKDPRRALTYGVTSTVLRKLDRLDEAERELRAKLELFVGTGDERQLSNAMVGLGMLEEQREQWAKALDWYEKAREIFARLQVKGPDVGFVAGAYGRMLVVLDRPEQALEPLREGLAYYRANDRAGAKLSAARIEGSLALALHALGKAGAEQMGTSAHAVLEADGGVDTESLRARLAATWKLQ